MQPLGQHFLISGNVLDRIIGAADLSASDTVLEIGPGRGVLTNALAARAGRVIAVEKDLELTQALRDALGDRSNVEVIGGDVRDVLRELAHPDSGFANRNVSDFSRLRSAPWKVVANIPYYLTSRLIRQLLELPNPPELIVLMVQREVAERIVARPPQMNLLGLSVQYLGEPRIVAIVPPGAFKPPPTVESAVIRIVPHKKRKTPVTDAAVAAPDRTHGDGRAMTDEHAAFFALARAGFSQKRKTIANNLAAGLRLAKEEAVALVARAAIEPGRRAQTLSVDEWRKLTNEYKKTYNIDTPRDRGVSRGNQK
ncbi:MAG: 16S rRNA (adenine(1518)-N(6)/adenine(1519)-N(6))-dimethyltransferase RsmA [bacterium]|nr:16S rRNA (adenine(1518)-N(6)/adenine(1519)-N(6))-dimethyltransferase RsmA [bacterium]MDZ4296506.1 16S rRNA (adenine(1518)-N(6)/adenine(1519)-N(6))-dimethyltransferase RsmA [Patescibacteria group bacterium]